MLTRLAANCFWMSRYLERADNLTHVVSAALELALSSPASQRKSPWDMTVAIALDEAESEQDGDSAVNFLLLNQQHYSSLWNCFRQARNNARTAKHLLTERFWEALNNAWLEMQTWDEERLHSSGTSELMTWAMSRLDQVRGAATDLQRGELIHVMDAGTALERIDYMARLTARCFEEMGSATQEPGSPDFYRWRYMMNASGTIEHYRRLVPTPGHIAQSLNLLLFSPNLPRSLVHQLDNLAVAVRGLCGRDNPETASEAEQLREQFIGCKNIPTTELPQALLAMVAAANTLSSNLQNAHFTLPDLSEKSPS
jgi:uncharacterized alpha-E superfamily protein